MSKFEITDEMLYKSCENAEKILIKNIPNKEDIDYRFSNKFNKKMNHLIKVSYRSRFKNSCYKYLNRIAVVFVIVSIGLFTVTTSVEALRMQLFNVIKEVYEKFTSYTFTTDVSTDKEFEILEPKYIPNGFKEIERIDGFDEKIIIYSNDSGEEITYHYYKVTNGQTINDTEVESIDNILINGIKAEYMVKGNMEKLIWNDNEHMYMISVHASEASEIKEIKKEVEKMAKSIK